MKNTLFSGFLKSSAKGLVTAFATSVAMVSGLAMSTAAMALSSDRDQPAQIEADNTEIDFRTGVRTLTNNVLVVQGTLRVKADKLVANYNKQGDLIKAVADGSLARFKQRPDDQPDDVEGWAKKIIVDYPKNTITLIGKAALKQGASTANGDTIVYNMATDKLNIKNNSRIGVTGKNGAKPKRKIEDPFKDDVPSPNSGSGKTKVAKSSNSAETEPVSEEKPETAEPAPQKSGRSRLILQPKKKD